MGDVDPSGAYAITSSSPAWTFGGTVGQPPCNLNVISGADGIGGFSEIAFTYTATATVTLNLNPALCTATVAMTKATRFFRLRK